jgi:hypothetical protein
MAPELFGESEDELPVRPSKYGDIYFFGDILLQDLHPCNEIINPAVGPHQQNFLIVTQPSPDVYTLILIIDLS